MCPRPIRLSLLALAFAILPLSARAQDTTVVSVGARLRIRTDISAVTGTLLASPMDSIVIERSGSPLRLPRERVLELERFAGQRTYKLRGALIGGTLAALLVGTIVYMAADNQRPECDPDMDPWGCALGEVSASAAGETAFALGLLSGAVGAGIGALIGSAPRDQYEPVPAPWTVE